MVRSRRGISSLGCLLTLLILAAVGYFGVTAGEHYFRFYQYQDSMRQEVRFAAHNSDALILRHLRERADSLGLPEAAGEVSLKSRPADARDAEIGRLKAKVGELTMANELLGAKIEHLEAHRPLDRRRSRR